MFLLIRLQPWLFSRSSCRFCSYRGRFRTKMNPPSRIYLQIVGSATGDSFPSIMLISDRQRYLFNCGEGLQRFCTEHRVRLAKIKHVFFTRLIWERLGGLPGLGLTLRESGASEGITLHGPQPLTRFVQATRHFLYKGVAHYKNEEFMEDLDKSLSNDDDRGILFPPPCLEDDIVTLWPIVTDGLKLTAAATTDDDDEDDEKSVRKTTSKRKQYTDYAISYIGKLADVRGKFLPNKAKALGVPMGPAFSRLTKGETVTLNDGTQVNPSDCMEQPSPGPTFFIIECPSENHWSQLVSNKMLIRYAKEKNATVAVHITPHSLFSSSQYQEWLVASFGSCQHIVINEQTSPQRLVYLRQSQIQARLHAIDPNVFPLPATTAEATAAEQQLLLPQNVTAGDLSLKFHFRPDKLKGFDTSDLLAHPNLKDICEEMKKRPDMKLCLDQINLTPRQPHDDDNDDDNDVEITFSGTASSVPSKYRNVSGILLRLGSDDSCTSMMMDCGEGTYGQLLRTFGDEIKRVLASICCIFISHIHADHHLGLIQILMEREKVNPHPVVIVGPLHLRSWLVEYVEACHPVPFKFLYSGDMLHSGHKYEKTFAGMLGMKEFICVPVIHCRDAFGIVFQHRDDWKMVYSGDTRPCPALVKAGANATVVIHEATHEDELQQEAINKNHCTMSEAIQCGIDMNTKMLILTHFSLRYPKFPVISKSFTSKTALAYDLMKLKLKDVDYIARLVPAIELVFKEEQDDQEDKSMTMLTN
ncbi:zinc phosphodiesterase ELAC protein 2-like isoform X2 [Oscarella lobularis]|uniref:zinc phosphodiesterase ELAC protein 2-like isoform X2 n=1 Tax=Oscarella lobularis TaxID=121494 RepID=UPI003313363A